MPTFSKIDVEVETDNGKETLQTDVDFEVFCGRCGSGLCQQSDTRQSYRRNHPQVTVEPCEKCLKDAAEDEANKAAAEVKQEKDQEIDDLLIGIDALKKRVAELEAV